MSNASLPSDLALLQGDQRWLTALARRLVQDSEAAQDLVQEVWLAALRDGQTHPTRPWLARVLRNRAISSWRSSARRSERERAAAQTEAVPSSFELSARVEAEARLANAVLALGEPYTETLLLRWREELSIDEIARRQGVAASSVRSRLTRARARLREQLGEGQGDGQQRWAIVLAPLLRPTSKLVLGAAAGPVLAIGLVAFLATLLLWIANGAAPAGEQAHGRPAGALRSAAATSEDDSGPKATSTPLSAPADAAVETARDPVDHSARLEVSFVNTERGGPIPEATVVEVQRQESQVALQPRRQRWDGNGPLVFDGLTPGGWQVFTSAGHLEVVQLKAGETQALPLSTEPLVRREVVVLDPEGEPVPGARLALEWRQTTLPIGRTDAAGRSQVVVRASTFVRASAPGLAPQRERVERHASDPLTVVLAQRAPDVEVRLEGPAGVEAWIEVRPRVRVEMPEDSLVWIARLLHTGPLRTGEAVHIHGAGRGLGVWVQASAPGFACASSEHPVDADGGCVVVHRLAPGASVAGRVRESDGSPAAGVAVTRFGGGLLAPSAITGHDGRFLLHDLPAGPVRLKATRDLRSSTGEVELVAGSLGSCDLVLPPMPTVRVRLVDSDGAPVTHAEVTLSTATKPAQSTAHATVDADGRAVLRAREEGPYAINVAYPLGTRFRPIREGVQEGEELEVVLDSFRGGVRVRALGPDGSRLSEAWLLVERADGGPLNDGLALQEHLLATGFAAIPAGEYALRLRDSDHGTLWLGSHHVWGDAPLELGDVAFDVPGWIEVGGADGHYRILSEAGGWQASHGTLELGETDRRGPFQPGAYRLTWDGDPDREQWIRVRSGRVTRVP